MRQTLERWPGYRSTIASSLITFSRDGSSFKLVRLEPTSFGGEKGFRFEYSVTRKADNVQLSGVGFGVVSKGELFAILYLAPKLAFFPRHQGQVDQIARSARLKM